MRPKRPHKGDRVLVMFDASREMYRITEGLQREKQSLMKQLDLLR